MAKKNGAQSVEKIPGRKIVLSAGVGKTNIDEFLKNYLSRHKNEQLTLSPDDIKLLKANSDKLAVYTVIVTAESNIKDETKPPFKRFLNVICKKQDNGSWLVHKLES